jgi:uncharacterized protein DUF29
MLASVNLALAGAGPGILRFGMSGRSLTELYEDDSFAWTQLQAKELRRFARSRPNLRLDLAHIAEEIGDLGNEQRNALRGWTARIIEHLLLLEHSPAEDPRRGWIEEVVNLRRKIELRMTPTLRRDLHRQLPRLYEHARRHLQRKLELYGEPETGSRFPDFCCYTLDQVLGGLWPAGARQKGRDLPS